MAKITTLFVTKAQPPPKEYKIHWDDRLPGYGLRVNSKGRKSFVAHGRLKGLSVCYTIGPFGRFTEYEAREEARQILQGLSKGIDPRTIRKRAEGMTLLELAQEYVARPTVNMKARSREAIMRHVNTTFEDTANKPIAAITEDYVRRRYEFLLQHGLRGNRPNGSPTQAKQAHTVLSAMLRYAVEMNKGIDNNRKRPVWAHRFLFSD